MARRLRIPLFLYVGLAAVASGLAARPAAAVVLAPGDLVAVVAERQIVRADRATGAVELISSGGLMTTVYGMAFEPDGKLAALGFSSRCSTDPSACGPHLFRIDPADGSQMDVSTFPPESSWAMPFQLLLEPGGRTVVFLPNPDLHRVDLQTGAVTIVASIPASGGISYSVAVAPDGTIYASDAEAGALYRIDPVSGAVALVADGLELGAGFYRTHGIAVDLQGFVVGTRYDPPALLRVDPATGEQTEIASGGVLSGPSGLVIDRDGAFWVAEVFADALVRIDPTTGEPSSIGLPYVVSGFAMVPYPVCSNGRDDDGDGRIDFDGGIQAGTPAALRTAPDPQCASQPGWNSESHARACGLGGELAVLAWALQARNARRMRRIASSTFSRALKAESLR
jgi:hypothetical protein